MILATDVGYRDDGTALAAAVGFAQWADEAPAYERTVHVAEVAEYEPGQFYRRELPCLLALRAALPAPPTLWVVDGHVWLRDGQPGLGAYLFEALRGTVPVVGVAKRAFRDGVAIPVCRGQSANPLHISAAGLSPERAAEAVQQMHGPWRIPTLLKRVDALSRSARGPQRPTGTPDEAGR